MISNRFVNHRHQSHEASFTLWRDLIWRVNHPADLLHKDEGVASRAVVVLDQENSSVVGSGDLLHPTLNGGPHVVSPKRNTVEKEIGGSPSVVVPTAPYGRSVDSCNEDRNDCSTTAAVSRQKDDSSSRGSTIRNNCREKKRDVSKLFKREQIEAYIAMCNKPAGLPDIVVFVVRKGSNDDDDDGVSVLSDLDGGDDEYRDPANNDVLRTTPASPAVMLVASTCLLDKTIYNNNNTWSDKWCYTSTTSPPPPEPTCTRQNLNVDTSDRWARAGIQTANCGTPLSLSPPVGYSWLLPPTPYALLHESS